MAKYAATTTIASSTAEITTFVNRSTYILR